PFAEIAARPEPRACCGLGSVPTSSYGAMKPLSTRPNNHSSESCSRGSSKLYSVPHTSASVKVQPVDPASQDHWVCPSTPPEPFEAKPSTATLSASKPSPSPRTPFPPTG